MTTSNSKLPILAEEFGLPIYDSLISLILRSVFYGEIIEFLGHNRTYGSSDVTGVFISLAIVSASGFLIQ